MLTQIVALKILQDRMYLPKLILCFVHARNMVTMVNSFIMCIDGQKAKPCLNFTWKVIKNNELR